MSDASSDRDPVERLAEEFAARLRNGEHPTLAEYAERHPDLASQILELFPVLLAMEQLKPAQVELTGPYAPSAGARPLERLGDYRILREVGRGGMGVVYEAEQLSLGRRVALKVLPAHALAGEQRLERFQREARAAAKLHHTNIVPVFGVGEADGVHFYAMQFIPGQPLDQVLGELRRFRQQPALSPTGDLSLAAHSLLSGQFAAPEPPGKRPTTGPGATLIAPSGTSTSGAYWRAVARLGVQAGQALAYAHAHGILHRDVKPSNLLLDPQGTLWVTDFGLAKGTDDDNLTAAGDVVGTLRYMAPERFEGRCDLRADVYALGLTLYELIAFRPAYAEKNREKLIAQITQQEPDRPSHVNPEVPRDLETIILKAIARDPEARYPTAAALAEDLQRFVEDRPILARRASSLERLARWSRRNPVVASLTGGIAVLTLALLAVAIGAAIYFSGVNRDLTDALGRESEARQKAIDEGQRAATAADLAQQRLGRLYLENGLRSDDPATRLLWFAEALKWDHENPERAEAHRLRVLTHLPEAAGPEHVFPVVSHGAATLSLPFVTFSRNRRYLSIGGLNFETDVWDLGTGEKVVHSSGIRSGFKSTYNPHASGFYLDDRRFLAPEEQTVQLWDLEKRQPLTPHLDSWTRITPDGRRLLIPAGTDGPLGQQFTVRDGETGKELFHLVLDFSPWVKADPRHAPGLRAHFTADGQQVAFQGDEGQSAAFDLNTSKPVAGQPPPAPFVGGSGIPLSTGHLLLTGTTGGIYSRVPYSRIIDRFTNQQVFPPTEWGATRFVLSDDESTAFVYRHLYGTPEGAALLLASGDPLGTAANLAMTKWSADWQAWDWRTSKPLGPPIQRPISTGISSSFEPISSSPVTWIRDWSEHKPWPAWANHLLFERNGPTLRLHDVRTGKVFSQFTFPANTGDLSGLQLNNDASALLVLQGNPLNPEAVQLLAMPSLEKIGEPLPYSRMLGRSASFSPDGQYALVTLQGDTERLHLYQLVTTPARQLRSVRSFAGTSYSEGFYNTSRVTFNRQCSVAANVQDDGTVHLYHLPDGKLMQTIKPHEVSQTRGNGMSVRWLDGDTRLLIMQQHSVEIWDLTALPMPGAGPVEPMPGAQVVASWASPDGRRQRTAGTHRSVLGESLIVSERTGANPARALCQLAPGFGQQSSGPVFRFSRDGESLFGLGPVGGDEPRSGCLRAWNVTSGQRLDFPETPVSPPKSEPVPPSESPADALGARPFQSVILPGSLVLTRPDEQTMRRWHAGLEVHLVEEVEFDAPILYAGELAAIAADGEIDLHHSFLQQIRERIPGGPFRSAHEVIEKPSSYLLVGANGKPTLVVPSANVGLKEKLTVQQLAGTIDEPVVQADLLSGKKGLLPERFLAVRTAKAAYLWDRDNLTKPPTRIAPKQDCRQIAFGAVPGQGSFVLTEDTGSVALWEVGNSDKPFLTIEGDFAQVLFDLGHSVLALCRPDGKVVVRSITFDTQHNGWQVSAAVLWDVAATTLILEPGAKPTDRGYLVAPTTDGTVRLFDLRAGKPEDAMIPHGGPVDRVDSFVGPERWLTCGADGTARLWSRDGADFRPVGETLHFGKRIARVQQVSGQPLVLVVAEGGPACLIDLDGKKVRDYPTEEGASVWLGVGGLTLIISNRDGSLQSQALQGERSKKTVGAGTMEPVIHGKASSEDLLLAIRDRKARVYSSSGLAAGPEIEFPSRIKQVTNIVRAPTTPLLMVVGENGSCGMFNPFLGQQIGESVRPEGGVVAVYPHSNGRALPFLVIGGREALNVDPSKGAARLIAFDKPVTGVTELAPVDRFTTGRPCLLLHSDKEVRSFRFGPAPKATEPQPILGEPWPHDDEVTRAWAQENNNDLRNREVVITLAGKTLRCWSVNQDKTLGPPIVLEEEVLWAALMSSYASKDPVRLWAITPTAHSLWDVSTGTRAAAWPFPFGPARTVEGNPFTGGALRFVCKDSSVWQWQIIPASFSPTSTLPRPQRVTTTEGYESFELSPEGQRLFTRTASGTLQDWIIEGGTLRPGKFRLTDVARQPIGWWGDPGTGWQFLEGHDLAVIRKGALERWSLATGERLWRAEIPPEGETVVVALPGDKRLLTSQLLRLTPTSVPYRRVIRLWDAATGKALTQPIHGFEPRITLDGKHLLVAKGAAESRLVRAWRLDTGEAVPTPDYPGDPWRAGNSPDWRYCLSRVEEKSKFGGLDQTVGFRVHDSRTNRVLTPILKGSEASFSADGRYLRVGEQIYELPSGNLVGRAVPGLWAPPATTAGHQWIVRGAFPGWTWSPQALQHGNDTVLAAVSLRLGRKIDEGGEIISVSPDEMVQLRQKLDTDARPLQRWLREYQAGELRRLLALAEQEKKWGRVLELLVRLGDLEPDAADIRAHRIQARANMATVLGQRRAYGEAARLFREVFRDAPEREHADERYNAACSAARAGMGQGISGLWKAEDLSEWRKQACDWLRAELGAVRLDFEKTPTLDVARKMAFWERDDDFRAVRDPELLARLPADEVTNWKQLWADVAKLREKAAHLAAGSWKIDGKEIVQEATIPEALLLFGDAKWTDYDVELEAMPTQGTGEVSVVVRALGVNDLIITLLGGWNNTRHGIVPMAGGQLLTARVVAGNTKLKQWYRIKVEVRGKTCRLFMDGKLVVEHAPIPGLTGGVGLRTWQTTARFRNLKVTDPQGKVLFEGLPPMPGMNGPN